jgi:hypothetical protein
MPCRIGPIAGTLRRSTVEPVAGQCHAGAMTAPACRACNPRDDREQPSADGGVAACATHRSNLVIEPPLIPYSEWLVWRREGSSAVASAMRSDRAPRETDRVADHAASGSQLTSRRPRRCDEDEAAEMPTSALAGVHSAELSQSATRLASGRSLDCWRAASPSSPYPRATASEARCCTLGCGEGLDTVFGVKLYHHEVSVERGA